MSTGLKRRTRGMKSTTISPKLRAFFERGALPDGGDPTNTSEDGDIFIMACSDNKTSAGWDPYRKEFLAEWKREKHEGLPWAEGVFQNWERNAGK